MTPAISVVVPVYNGAATLRLCLAALGRTRGPSWECIVVDDDSDDDSAGSARSNGSGCWGCWRAYRCCSCWPVSAP